MRPTTRRALRAAHTTSHALAAAARGTRSLLRFLLEAGRRIRITYTAQNSETTVRVIDPLTIGRNKKTGIPYVRAYDHLRGEHRTFTLPSITDYAETA